MDSRALLPAPDLGTTFAGREAGWVPRVAACTDGQYTAVVLSAPDGPLVPRAARDAVFVFGVSGQTGDRTLDAGRRATRAALRGLVAGDRFMLVSANLTPECFAPGFVAWDEGSVAEAEGWIERAVAEGGAAALQTALDALPDNTPSGRVRTVLVLTDDALDGDGIDAAVGRHQGRSLVSWAGIGCAAGRSRLKTLAGMGGGAHAWMTPDDPIERRIAALDGRLAEPVAWNVQVAGGEAAWPEPFTLFTDRRACALIAGGPASMSVVGQGASGSWRVRVSPQRVTAPLGSFWARERLAWLDEQMAADPARGAQVQRETTLVALEHDLVSRGAGRVAADEIVAVSAPRLVAMNPAAALMRWADSVVRRKHRMEASMALRMQLTLFPITDMPDAVAGAARGPAVPRSRPAPRVPRRAEPRAARGRAGRAADHHVFPVISAALPFPVEP